MDRTAKQIANSGIPVKENEPLKKHTTIKVGGPAKYFVETENSQQLLTVLSILNNAGEKYFLLGKGSNIVVSDKGINSFVIYNYSTHFKIGSKLSDLFKNRNVRARFDGSLKSESDEAEYIAVTADSGIRLQYLMNRLFDMDITGLEYFNGIPCTLGGAVYMNLHGGDKFISQYLISAELFSAGSVKKVDNEYFKFDYDYSLLHKTKEVVLKAELALPVGNGRAAKKRAADWAKIKSIQPKDSAGCIFKNLSDEQVRELKLNSNSVGYVIDKILKLKGLTVGGAKISELHAAFIENFDNASASDIYKLHLICKEKAEEKLNLKLETEVEFVGEF